MPNSWEVARFSSFGGTTCCTTCETDVPKWLSSKEREAWMLYHRIRHLEGAYDNAK